MIAPPRSGSRAAGSDVRLIQVSSLVPCFISAFRIDKNGNAYRGTFILPNATIAPALLVIDRVSEVSEN
jgi:hypothetical protein